MPEYGTQFGLFPNAGRVGSSALLLYFCAFFIGYGGDDDVMGTTAVRISAQAIDHAETVLNYGGGQRGSMKVRWVVSVA